MPIEVLILSGVRRGEQLKFDKDRISIGDDRESDVYFSPRKHPEASGKRAQLVLDEYGWRIHNVGEGDWYLNQTILPVSGASPLRSGDVVRVSEVGPDFRFTILPEAKPAASKHRTIRPAAEQETEAMPLPAAAADNQSPGPRTSYYASVWPAVAVGVLAFLAVLAGLIALRSSGSSSSQPPPAVSPETNPPANPVEGPDG